MHVITRVMLKSLTLYVLTNHLCILYYIIIQLQKHRSLPKSFILSLRIMGTVIASVTLVVMYTISRMLPLGVQRL